MEKGYQILKTLRLIKEFAVEIEDKALANACDEARLTAVYELGRTDDPSYFVAKNRVKRKPHGNVVPFRGSRR